MGVSSLYNGVKGGVFGGKYKVLNLYACLEGNRYKWAGNVEAFMSVWCLKDRS